MLAEARTYSKMATGIARILRMPPLTDPARLLRERLLKRDDNFLALTDRAIFQNPANPFHTMFKLAGCTHGDLTNSVRRHGLNPTLERLRREGVYVAHEELKGRQAIVRQGREIPGRYSSFSNPSVRGYMESSSSGSTGKPVRGQRSIEAVQYGWAQIMLRYQDFNMQGSSLIFLRPILPTQWGMMLAIQNERLGVPIDRWYSFDSNHSTFPAYKLLTRSMLTWARMQGAHPVYPEFLDANDFSPAAAHIAKRRSEGRRVFVQGPASQMVRIAGAAIERGMDISGTIFQCWGESLTPGKSAIFERAGCRGYAQYALNEGGHAGISCHQCVGNTVHLLEDGVAVIRYPRPSPYDSSIEVNSLHFTSVTPYASSAWINAEADDAGDLVPATCDCTFSRIGFKTLITNINSFGKVSPQGLTFDAAEIQHVLEVQMPAAVGGRPGDFQLVEYEATNGQSQLRLHVSPRVGVTEKKVVSKAFLDIMRPRYGGALATRTWESTDGIEVVIAEPQATRSGKIHAVRLMGELRLAQSRRMSEESLHG